MMPNEQRRFTLSRSIHYVSDFRFAVYKTNKLHSSQNMLLLVLYTLSITTTFAIDVSNSLESDLFLPEAFGTKFGVLTSQQKNYSLVDNLDVKSKLRWEYATRSGYRIGIYDNVLTSPHLRILQAWTTYKLGSWSYRLHETDVKGGQNHVSENDFPWYIELDVIKFSESIVGKQLQKVVAKFSQEESMNYHPFKVVGHVIRRGDFPKVYTDADSEANEVSMMIYLNKEWRKNDYGDLYLYDDDKEIVAGVVPRHGRIVVWQSSIPYLPRPPSVAFKPGQLFLHIYFTKNQTKVHDIHSKWQKNEQNRSVQQDEFFTPEEHNRALKEIAVQSHLVSEAKSKDGKRIVTFDGLFSKHDLDNLRSAILNYGVYYYDDSYNKESDNVQWIAAFKVDSYIKSNLWKITQEVAKHVSGGQSEWFPYDVSCNLIRNADTTQIHHDCDVHEGEWTFLLYLNPEWTINDYGETVFYERNDDDTEIITEVLPKYGRVVIFQGVIPHSARPPSTNFTGARLSFAVKLSKNEWTGRQKACQELFRQFSAVKRGLVAPKKIFDEKDKASSDTPGNHQPHDHSRKTKSNEESSDDDDDDDYDDDDDDNDDDPELLKIEESLSKDNIDVEDLRTLFRDLTKHHQQAIENLGEELQKYL